MITHSPGKWRRNEGEVLPDAELELIAEVGIERWLYGYESEGMRSKGMRKGIRSKKQILSSTEVLLDSV